MPKDTREILRAIRMPGERVKYEVPGKGEREKFQAGPTVTDPDELAALAAAKKVNLQSLYDAGDIVGDWKGIKT